MHECCLISTANMMYNRLQNYTNMEYNTFKVVVIVLLHLLLSFDVFAPTSAYPLLCFGQVVSPNILLWTLMYVYIHSIRIMRST